MQIRLIQIGKTDLSYIRDGFALFFNRIGYYVRFESVVIPDVRGAKKRSATEQKSMEGSAILAHLQESDYVVLLDESGQQFHSEEFAAWMQRKMNAGTRRICFVIGGPYGFSREVYARAQEMLSLSKMTFSYQMVRLIFAEQLYRAFTIINGEPYHHR